MLTWPTVRSRTQILCLGIFFYWMYTRKPQGAPAGGYISTVSCHSNFDCCEVHTRSFQRLKMSEKQRKCSVCLGDMLPWDNHQACLKCRNDKKGKDKCVVSKESDCSICWGLKNSTQEKSFQVQKFWEVWWLSLGWTNTFKIFTAFYFQTWFLALRHD